MRWLLTGLILMLSPARAEELRVAVAANFLETAQALAARWQADGGTPVVLSSGSTGKLYAQIVNGAPFALFLAADADRPQALQRAGLLAEPPRDYALGRLVLWAPTGRGDGERCRRLLDDPRTRIALANPATAPYGVAAQAVLDALGIDSRQAVRGESVGQTYAFARSGNVDAAFVAASQLASDHHPGGGCRWPVPADLHPPLVQQLARVAGSGPAAAALADFITGPRGRELIRAAGYALPGDD